MVGRVNQVELRGAALPTGLIIRHPAESVCKGTAKTYMDQTCKSEH